MELLKVLPLRGPNVWAPCPVLEVWTRATESAPSSPEYATRLNQRLIGWFSLPLTRQDRTAILGDLLRDLRGGLQGAALLARLTIELQTLAGTEVAFQGVAAADTSDVVRFAVEYYEPAVARGCLAVAHEACLAAADQADYPFAAKVHQLRELAEDVCLGPSTRAIVRAAAARGIPYMRLNTRSLVQLGHGVRQHRIRTAETDRTGTIAEYISQDKELTKRLVRAAGVPVPEGRLVCDPADAWAAASEIGAPVVVKPINGNHGRGVFTDLVLREQVEAVFPLALAEGDGVLVERCARGSEHRLLVVGDHMVAATRGDPAVAVGDGRRTILELVDELNRDPRRGEEDDCPLAKIEFADPTTVSLVRVQGYHPESIPPAGAQVVLQRNGNLSIDVTDDVHPEVARCAVLAARAVGLDIAGIDMVTADISRPLESLGGVVVEVNASPGLQMHLQPSSGHPRDVGTAIAAHLFAPGHDGRIPIVAVFDGNGAAETFSAVVPLLAATCGPIGATSGEQVSLDGRRISLGRGSAAVKVRELLTSPIMAAGVFHVAAADVLAEGLGFDRCQAAIIAPPPPSRRGSADGDTVQARQRAETTAVVLRTVDPSGAGICWADDPLAAEAPSLCAGRLILVAERGDHPGLTQHRAQSGVTVFCRDDTIVVAEGDRETCVAGPQSAAPTPALSRLFAVAAAWALHVPLGQPAPLAATA